MIARTDVGDVADRMRLSTNQASATSAVSASADVDQLQILSVS